MAADEKTPLSISDEIGHASVDEYLPSEHGVSKSGPSSDLPWYGRMLSRVATRARLPWYRKLAYGVGHVFNDMAASMWFTYLILFYHKVIELDNALAGTLLLIGQLVDGLSTPVIGYLCDVTPFWYMGFGRRKIWHLLGTLLVAFSLFFFWHKCLPCQATHVPMAGEIVWYAVFIAIFQVGWASVQISHLSLIPELTEDENERVGLNAIRSEQCQMLFV